MKIVGIDPGNARVGYGVITVRGNTLTCDALGVIEIPPQAAAARLAELETQLAHFLAETRPDRIGIERLFFAKNKRTGIAVAEARGVILLTAGKAGVPLIELSPGEVKRAVTGNGTASKQAVAKMVRWILGLTNKGAVLDDATDALAIAIAAAGRGG